PVVAEEEVAADDVVVLQVLPPLAHEQVEIAVAVDVGERRGGLPRRVGVERIRLVGEVDEAPAPVLVEAAAPVVGDEQVPVTVAVDVGGGAPHPGPAVVETGGGGGVREAPVAEVAVEPLAAAGPAARR